MVERIIPETDPPQVEYVWEKTMTRVSLDDSLDLAPYDKDGVETPSRYELIAMVHHWGRRAASGHYTAHGRRPSRVTLGDKKPTQDNAAPESHEEWISFDDGHTRSTKLDQIQARHQETAYLLLYRLLDGSNEC